ncbi:hypothetical protein SAMN02799631_04022 [Methylobacterium sp. 174MFSha1.1]|uniref:hypothetical protein n=1 Tax=Methylobacterium sp. 174MFSha1.1 TaxID=1502749 RepID=UPI0008E9669D|nr:hypothetical protein [Methylobacterium sp. 174MFSha1.1]SFV03681.1 hypothetical protein SAMN02799631_04022 [Methylobacterium sp. 174MFSha1.1]
MSGAGPESRTGRAAARGRTALLLLPLLATGSLAQTSPTSVNDCTLLPDPGALRRCLDQVEGRVANPAGLPGASAATALDAVAPAQAQPRGAADPSPPARRQDDFLKDKAAPWDGPAPGRAVIDLR